LIHQQEQVCRAASEDWYQEDNHQGVGLMRKNVVQTFSSSLSRFCGCFGR
jgi:hypothetical protein